MLYSSQYIHTMKETPMDAEAISHQLMLRAGLIRKISTGIYAYLPIGCTVLHKIMEIVRRELNQAGCVELLLPALLPAEPWKKTGRWDLYGKEMFKLTDRSEREFCLGPTHEEIITEVVHRDVQSYRDLPLFLYQIQTKYRDEPRPRFGIIRSKEFIMKDLYSFHATLPSLEEGYHHIYQTYHRIFEACALQVKAVEADNGAIGGSFSHEFVADSSVGETAYALCPHCGWASTLEAAKTSLQSNDPTEDLLTKELVATPQQKTIAEISAFLSQSPDKILKTLLYQNTAGKRFYVVVRGSDSVNETKLKKVIGEEVFLTESDPLIGFLGPVDVPASQIIADTTAIKVQNAVTGASKADHHYLHVNYQRDWRADRIEDIRELQPGDPCPTCGAGVFIQNGLELGHTFLLNDRYTKPLDASFVNESGAMQPMYMGCYGIGITRMVAAVIEQHHDEKGIIWPKALAPFAFEIIPVNITDALQMKTAKALADALTSAGYECLLDDRPVSAGVKFNDADLIGIPIRLVCGKALQKGEVEVKIRKTCEIFTVSVESAIPTLTALYDKQP
ncbi:proline--tRNA ligase [bacterium]|nr:proline--tRNA ligase [bacterium]